MFNDVELDFPELAKRDLWEMGGKSGQNMWNSEKAPLCPSALWLYTDYF